MNNDPVVIGGGAAGLAAARAATARGRHPLLVTDSPPGGECTFTGCVPSKALLEAAARGADFDTAMRRVHDTVRHIAATEDEAALKEEGIEVLRGTAAFVSPREVVVGDSALRADRFVVATGSEPTIPTVRGLDALDYLTNDSVFGLTRQPRALVVLGGGAVGCELAQAFAHLGSDVTVVEARDRLLPGEDPQASAVLADALAADGVRVLAGTTVTRARLVEGRAWLDVNDHEPLVADRVLVVVGRSPTTAWLGLWRAGVRTDRDGAVRTSEDMSTTTPGIYAAGDVTGRFALTHAAHLMGRIAGRNAVGRGRSARLGRAAIPRVVYTEPEVAHVGMSENDAAREHPGSRVAYLPMAEVDRAVTAGRTEGFVKIVAGPRSMVGHLGGGRVLGGTVVCPRAGELVHEIALAMRTGMFAGRLAQTVHAYPTWSTAIQQAAAQLVVEYGGRTARPARPQE